MKPPVRPVMEIARRPVGARLRAFADDPCGYVERGSAVVRRREFPFTRVVLVFELGPSLRVFENGSETQHERFPGGFVAGLGDQFTVTEHDGHQAGIQMNFSPIGARLLFGIPMSELAGRTVRIADLLPREHHTLAERLADLPSWDARFDLLETILAARIEGSRTDVRSVDWALRRIEASAGAIDMRTLARELGYSPKHVITMFRDQVGITPKLLARIARFDRLAKHLRGRGRGSWAELAHGFGYADQSHLVREVRAFTGLTPTEARREIAGGPSEVNSVQDWEARAS